MSVREKRRFAGKVAFVTGGGDGIGRAVALQFARDGASVVVAGRTEAKIKETVHMIDGGGGKGLAVPCDVRDENQVRAALEKVKETFGRLDIAVNNAGVEEKSSPAAEQSTEEWRRVLDTNVIGTFLCLKYEVPLLVEQGGGSIVNISSGAGVIGVRGQSAYVASKHAVIGFTKSVALDYVQKGIRVNAVAPGMTASDMMLKRITGGKPENTAKAISSAPIGRFAKTDEIANAVTWLVSDEASYMIGAVVVVDGGQTIVKKIMRKDTARRIVAGGMPLGCTGLRRYSILFGCGVLFLASVSCNRAQTTEKSPLASLRSVQSNKLRAVADFAVFPDRKERSRALFLEASRVLLHPRCANCHPDGDAPAQGMQMTPHQPPVTRGPEGHGVSAWSVAVAIRTEIFFRPAFRELLIGILLHARWRGLERPHTRSVNS